MWMELIAIVVTLVLTAFFVEGGLGVGHVLTMLLDEPTIVTILMLSLPILLWNGMWKDFVRGFRLLRRKKERCRSNALFCSNLIISVQPVVR